jgi:hypothetical protein
VRPPPGPRSLARDHKSLAGLSKTDGPHLSYLHWVVRSPATYCSPKGSSQMSILIPGPETRVNTTTANDQWYAAMAGLSDGGYVVIWISDYQDSPSVNGRRR